MRCLKSLGYQKKKSEISSLKFTYLNILKPAQTSTWYFHKILFQLLALNYQSIYDNKNDTQRILLFPSFLFTWHASDAEEEKMKSRNKFLYAKLSLQQTLILLLAPVNLITLNIKDLYLNAVHINEYKFRWGCDKFSSAESSKLSLDNERLLLKKKKLWSTRTWEIHIHVPGCPS